MPSAAFEASLPFILRWEGGYVNNPNDPGGATNKGVTQTVYDAWRRKQGSQPRGVKQITDAEVQAIYDTGYWLPPRCNVLQQPLDLVQFDTAVNMGPGRAVRFLQQAVGCAVDGGFGPNTLKARSTHATSAAPSFGYCDDARGLLSPAGGENPKLKVFLKGWTNRLNALRTEVGLPGFETVAPLDFGDTGYIAKVPDLGVSPDYDL